MRNMSFAMTQRQILEQTKFVTRRFGWLFLKLGDLLQPVDRCMGFKKGEHPVKLGCPIRASETRWEPLDAITPRECFLEGFPHMKPQDFVDMMVRHYRCKRDALVNRIRFWYTKGV